MMTDLPKPSDIGEILVVFEGENVLVV